MRNWAAIIAICSIAAAAPAQTLPSGWKIHPTGVQIAVDTFPMASVASPDGKYLLVMNAGTHAPSISVIDIAAAKETSRTPVAGAWLGLTMTKAGDKVYVGGGSRAAVFEFSFSNGVLTPARTFPLVAEPQRTAQDFAGDVRFSPDGRLLYVANLFRDSVVVINPQSGVIVSRIRTGRRPYRILFHPSGKSFYVSSWADGSVGQYDANSGQRIANFRVAPHPLDMLWIDGAPAQGKGADQPEIKARMFVAAANTNSIYEMGATETGDLTKLDTISVAISPDQPFGMTPSAIAGDMKQIYVACADANAVAVVDLTGERAETTGFIAAGWYPAAITALKDGTLAIANARGNTVQLTAPPDAEKLFASTKEVTANIPAPPSTAFPQPPIHHVIYVVRDGGAKTPAPNRDALAKQFISLTNFRSLAENAAEGVNWATAAIAPDFTERLAQNADAGRRKVNDFEGQDPSNLPPAGYLWNAASQAGLKFRNYGFQVHNLDKPTADGEQVDRVYDPALAPATDMEYRGPDQGYPDLERAKEFAEEMKEYDGLSEMPPLLLVRIGNDDAALGILADAVSHSKFWNDSAMFVVDAQGDVDHKTTALVVSPWVKHGVQEDAFYNQISLLKTVEAILGLRPMTTYDTAATSMNVFSGTANPAPYTPAGR